MPDQENPATESVPRAGAPESPKWSILMHPAFFITASTLVGLLFALQEWGHMNLEGYRIGLWIVFGPWGLQYFLWGIIGWVLWRLFRPFIQTASIASDVHDRPSREPGNLLDRDHDLGCLLPALLHRIIRPWAIGSVLRSITRAT